MRKAMSQVALWRRLLAELLGSAFLAAVVIGSGIAAQRYSPGATGLELLENAAATAAGLFAIIAMFGPVSGGHFNPVVSFVDAAFGGLSWRDAAAYLPAQVAGCTGGAVLANLMFALPAVSISAKHRATPAHFRAEIVATLGLMLVIFALARSGQARSTPRRSAPTSARPISSPPPPASPTRRSPSAGCSPTRSPASPPRRVHLLHSMADTFAVMRTIEQAAPASAVIVGAGYIGLEMADALTIRGLAVTQLEQLPEVLPTVDPALGGLVHAELAARGVEVLTGTTVRAISRAAPGQAGRLAVQATAADGAAVTRLADMVLVVVGVRPDTTLAAGAGATLGVKDAIAVDRAMRTGLPDVFAAGDCVVTHHRLLGETYLPLGTTAHKQGRVAGENATGGNRRFAGSLGTQVVKIFDQAAARTGLRDHEATAAGFDPVTIGSAADDHKAYYPGSHRITMRVTGDRTTGRLLGMQMFGHKHAEIAKRIDIAATAIFHGMTVDAVSDLDLSYTPPLGSPCEAVQMATQAWLRAGPAVTWEDSGRSGDRDPPR
jgi:NADPH-dependent 2,4-dienoyl-CoA reductase/sulfur reductase-like enzyme